MARASSRLPSALFLLFSVCSMSSIQFIFAVSLSLYLLLSGPSTIPILVFPGAACTGDSSTAKEVPLWKNHTGGITTYFSQITPYQSSSSCFASSTVSHVYGHNLGILPFPDSTTSWNSDCRFVAVESNTCFSPETGARGIDDVGSTENTGTTSPSKDDVPSAVFIPRSGVSYLSPVFDYMLYNGSDHPAFSAAVDLSGLDLSPLRGEIPSGQRYRLRKLLNGSTYGRRATRKQHVAIRGKVTPSWLEQAAVVGSALVGFICTVAGLVLCCIRTKRTLQSTASTELDDDGEPTIREPQLRRGLGPREFVYSELAAATDNFAEERKIGRGGFGSVYRGYLTDQYRHVAIKKLSQEMSVQGLKEFQAEVTIMSQLRHRNIVRLVGWCGRRGELALVYELVPGGSLDTHLYNPDKHLTWPQRYKIALGLGSALRYLHTDCDQCVVHGDIKPANVMLDASLDAKLGDFGLARVVDHGADPETTQVVAGTVGYIDPEFVSSRRPSAESDVYSFGVVLLQIACGRRPAPSRRSDQAATAGLLASVRDMYRRNVILEAADRRLEGEFDGMQMERLLVTGLWCAQQDPVQRPSIAQAVDVIRSEDAELPVLATIGGSDEEIRALEGQAYADLSAQTSVYLEESTETTYLTTEETSYLFLEE